MGKTFTPQQVAWQWYVNNAAEPSTALAAQVTKPTLADDAIIRLRMNVAEIGDIAGSGIVTLEYSTNDVDFTAFGSGNHWNYADGLATEGNTITGYLITPTADVLGLYHESATISESFSKSSTIEMDVTIQQTANVSANTTYYFRMSIGGVVVVPSVSHPQVLTYTPGLPDRNIDLGDSVFIADGDDLEAGVLGVNVSECLEMDDIPHS